MEELEIQNTRMINNQARANRKTVFNPKPTSPVSTPVLTPITSPVVNYKLKKVHYKSEKKTDKIVIGVILVALVYYFFIQKPSGGSLFGKRRRR